MFSTILSYLSIAVSFVVAFYFYKKQKKYYNQNMERLEKAKNFFLENPTYSILSIGNDKLIDESNIDGDLKNLVKELNKYMSRNKGTTDFSIIQNKTERFANTIFENASSNLAFPTYMGLMGTFVGVFIGLIGFVLPDLLREFGLDIIAEEESNITRLVYGVIVSMITSFMGLYYTTKSNRTATEYKRIMDERKNIFYDFIQNELMPVLGMSVVHALTQLKETLLNFHTQFDIITTKFKTTFDGCTERFGKAFSKNITAVSDAAEKLGSSIDAVNKNVENQQALLRELRSDGMLEALNQFVEAGKQFQQSSSTVKDLDKIQKELSSAITTLINVQREYNGSLVVPKLIAERINVILERVTTFEESINALGVNIAATQMLGNSEMALIQEHLANIKRKDAIAAEYQETANEELKALFDTEIKTIQELHRQYTSAIETHGDEFKVLMDQVAEAIVQKKREFMLTLQDAFDLTELQTEFAHLKQLPEIQEKIGSLNTTVDSFKTSVSEQSKTKVEKISKMHEELKEDIAKVASSVLHVEQLTEINPDTNQKVEQVAANIQQIDEKVSMTSTQVSLDNSVEGLKNLIESLVSRLETIQSNTAETVQIDPNTLHGLITSINQQRGELEVLDSLVKKTGETVNDNFAKLIDQKLKDVTGKVEELGKTIETIKEAANKK